MGYFQVRYDSRVVIYNRRGFIRLATGKRINDISRSHLPSEKVVVHLQFGFQSTVSDVINNI